MFQEMTTGQRARAAAACDHDRPYAPMAVTPSWTVPTRDRFRHAWLAASRTRSVTVVGPPMRVLMPPDLSPFPRIRLWRR